MSNSVVDAFGQRCKRCNCGLMPSDYTLNGCCLGCSYAEGAAMEERANIVAWLRSNPYQWEIDDKEGSDYAEAIERGEHMLEEEDE